MTTQKIKVGIVGGTGYTGVELLRLLAVHPNVTLSAITSRGEAGLPVAEMFPSLRGLVNLAFSDPATANLNECDVVFFATPHGVAMAQAPALVAAGVRVIDLAADFRLQDTAVFEKWYKMPHSCPDVLNEAVYGIPELNREQIKTRSLEIARRKIGPLVVLEDIVIQNIALTRELEHAIEAKMVQEQEASKSKYFQQRVQIEADTAVIKAKGEAESILIRGEALKKNPAFVDLQIVDRWDGIAPLVIGGKDQVLLNFQDLERLKGPKTEAPASASRTAAAASSSTPTTRSNKR